MNLSDVRYLPRWVILIIDVCFILFAIYFSKYLVEKLTFSSTRIFPQGNIMVLLMVSISVAFMFVFRTYAGIIRHSTFIDLFKLFIATFCTTVMVGLVSFSFFIFTGKRIINMSVPFLVLFFASSFMILFLFRLMVKEFFHIMREFRRSTLRKRILVLGIDEQAIAMARAVIDNANLPYFIVGFLTQRHDSKRANLLGKPIFTKEKIEKNTKDDLLIDGVLIIKEQMTSSEMNSWVNLFLEKDLQVFKAPSVQKLRSSDQETSIKTLQIEDLLNRKPIKIENEEVKRRHHNKNILITGGAGSIGSEIVRQVALFEPALIVVLDQAETPLYEIEMEMRNLFPMISFKFVLGDISNKHRIEPLFQKYQFSVVYHAAAYKHVPLIEENPHEAVLVNILGTKNLSTLASQYKVNRFVMVSTDKAVKPTNVMGASKRAAELFVQALQNTENNTTKFITTRFGNVLGSNGSVVPLFTKQINAGGPITITHPDIIRYFMTIPEACQLVLEAGAMGNGGEVYIFDMGKPVKIIDLAYKMIRLAGFTPDKEIKIEIVGLRPGEKLFEELLNDSAKTLPTHHDKILIAEEAQDDFLKLNAAIDDLILAANCYTTNEIVMKMKTIVPEFISMNSDFVLLDK